MKRRRSSVRGGPQSGGQDIQRKQSVKLWQRQFKNNNEEEDIQSYEFSDF